MARCVTLSSSSIEEDMIRSDGPLQASAVAAHAHCDSHTAVTALPLRIGDTAGANSVLSDGSSASSTSDDSDDESVLPMDSDSLQDELERVKETIQRLQDGTSDDFVLNCELLLAHKQTQVTRAYDNFERFKETAIRLYEYECEQAKARYHARCEELQLEMSDELQREIQRLKNTRDGVSVMDRRRLTRNSGGGAKAFDHKRAGGGGAGLGGSSASMGNGELNATANGNLQKIRPLTPGEEAYRLQFEEKKRLELLLSKTPVFKQLNQRLESDEADSDLAAITRAVQQRSGAPLDRIVSSKRRVAFPLVKSTSAVRVARKSTIRVFSSDDDYGNDDSDNVSYLTEDDESAKEDDGHHSVGRLALNPGMLQEGDKVVVVVHRSKSDEETKGREDDDAVGRVERTLAGVITATTATRVFLLCADGRFETVDVSDWKAGRVSVHAAETLRKRRRC